METKELIVEKSLLSRSYPSRGNAFRINDQSITRYPLTLIIHDQEHLELVTAAERVFGGKYPLGYIGTSPWPGTVTNQETMGFFDEQNRQLYELLCAQMEIGWVIYGLDDGPDKEISEIIRYMQEKCPDARHIRMKKQESDGWLEELEEEIKQSSPPVWFDSLDREEAEWSNLSITMPEEEDGNRILLVGDSISAGYGDMVQRLMHGWHVDRLNTSEGIHHPNFLRLLEIAIKKYPYNLIHINNGLHLHGQTVEQYEQNLLGVLAWIHMAAPGAKVVFATSTPLSRKVEESSADAFAGFSSQHFAMGGKPPVAKDDMKQVHWVTDEKASEDYEKLNEVVRKICKDHGIWVNDLYRLCVRENLQKTDGIHFCEEGYWRLAVEVAGALKRAL